MSALKQAIAILVLTLVMLAGVCFASARPRPKAPYQMSYCPSALVAPDGWALYLPCAFVGPKVLDL